MDPFAPYALGSESTVSGCGVFSNTLCAASLPRSWSITSLVSELTNDSLSTEPRRSVVVSAASD